jgi:energy-coupling factor transporter ATP-binding protein EcfA2
MNQLLAQLNVNTAGAFVLEALPTMKGTVTYDGLLSDLEIFTSFRPKNHVVFSLLNCCSLNGSKIVLENIIKHPIFDSVDLVKRQNALKSIKCNERIDIVLNRLKQLEPDVVWLFQTHPKDLQKLYEIPYFRTWVTKCLNNNVTALTIYNVYTIVLGPLLAIFSPLMYYVFPYLILRWRFGIKIPLVIYCNLLRTLIQQGKWNLSLAIVTFILYLHSVFMQLEVSIVTWNVCNNLVKRARGIREFIVLARELQSLIPESNSAISKWFGTLDVSIEGYDDMSNFSFGSELRWIKTIDKEHIRNIVKYVYQLDALVSIKKLFESNRMCYPVYSDDANATMSFTKSWHPAIEHPICNTIALDKHVLLTGPNAGGKSTILRSVLLNALLAQTFTICFAERGEITPFHHIDSKLSVPDDREHASLFESECLACSSLLKRLRDTPNLRTLIVMDELLSSTNPLDGICAAYAVASKIAGFRDRCCAMISTHYVLLSRLCKKGKYAPYQVSANVKDDGEIVYPYVLKKGVYRDTIGLEVMKEKGLFDDAVINTAMNIREKIQQSNKSHKLSDNKPICQDTNNDVNQETKKVGE